MLEQDSRRTVSEIASIAGVSRTTVKDRISLMRERGVIRRFTIDIAKAPQIEPACGSAFFQLRLHRPVCRIVYASINGWPEVIGCWSIAGELDMIVLALQLPFLKKSESMGNHDSNIVDASSVD